VIGVGKEAEVGANCGVDFGVGVDVSVGVDFGVGLGKRVPVGMLVGWMLAVGVGEAAHDRGDVNRMMGVRMSTVALHIIRTMMVAGFDRERERRF
jgi:hypothetical protein